MKRREFLGAAAATAIPVSATAAAMAEDDGAWMPTVNIGYVCHGSRTTLAQRYVHSTTGAEEWRDLPYVPWNGKKPGEA